MKDFGNQVEKQCELMREDYKYALSQGWTNRAWLLWSQAIEQAFIIFLDLKGKAARAQRGRGGPHFHSTSMHTKHQTIYFDDKCKQLLPTNYKNRLLKRKICLLDAWAARINSVSQPMADSLNFSENMAYIQRNRDNLLLILDEGDELEKSIRDFINNDCVTNICRKIKLKKFASDLRKVSNNINNVCKGELKDLNTKAAKDDRYHQKTWRNLRDQNLPPLLFANRTSVGPQGQPIGSVTAIPAEVDKIAREIDIKAQAG